MGNASQRSLAWLVVLAALLLQYPVQHAIDVYRNTLRVVMYRTATDQNLAAVKGELTKLGLQPTTSEVVVPPASKEGRPEEVKMISAAVPQTEWGHNLQKYVVPVQQLRKVANVVPGMNEQGIPLDQLQQLNVQDVGIIVMAALIGGFRKSAANVLWLQSDANWREGKHYRTVPLARAVVTLDPHFVDAWTLTCWHMAYNMSVEATTPDEAADLIAKGIDFAEQGLSWNGSRYEIYQEIGWTYYDKIQNYAMAAEYLKKAIEHPHPTFLERAIAHAYERIPDIEHALFWYNVSLKKYQDDHVATGAIITINERYVPAWKEYKKGNLKAALRQLELHWQKDDPFDTIGMHFKGRIYETEAENCAKQGDPEAARDWYRKAFEVWLAAGKHSSVDRLARRRVLTLASNFGWKTDIPDGWNDVGLPDSWAEKLKPESRKRIEADQQS